MNYRKRLPESLIILVATVVLSSCQTPTEKAAPSAAEATPPVNADNWQKSKECAEQAERVAVDYQRRKLPMGAIPGSNWADHYSPKGNRCFVEFWYTTVGNDPGKRNFRDVQVRTLEDAFERITIATWADNGCKIEDESVNCQKALEFISEHMRN
jgi:hypothetical protein